MTRAQLPESSLRKLVRFGKDPARGAILTASKQRWRGQSGGGKKMRSTISLPPEKLRFLSLVLGTTILQLLIALAVFIWKRDDAVTVAWSYSFFVTLILAFVLAFVPMPVYVKFVLYTLFSACIGAVLAGSTKSISQDVLLTALAGALTIFIVMLLVAIALTATGVDLSFLGVFLILALFGIVVIQLSRMLMGNTAGRSKWLTVFSLFLFACFILYDTNIILHKDYAGDFVTASLDYFMDFINIFQDIANLLSQGK